MVSVDAQDKRIRHLKTTPKAIPLIEGLYQMRDEWINKLLDPLDDATQSKLLDQPKKMADESCENLEPFLHMQNSFFSIPEETEACAEGSFVSKPYFHKQKCTCV